MKKIFGISVIGALMISMLTGCSQATSDASVDDSPTAAPAGEAASSTEGNENDEYEDTDSADDQLDGVVKGQPLEGAGYRITVSSVSDSNTIYLDKEYRGEYEPEHPESGAKFVTVVTTVKNLSKSSMDLTCGYALDVTLLSDDADQYDPIEDSSDIKGNPECNSSLQPKMSHKMIYVFEIPKEVTPAALYVGPGDLDGVDNDDPKKVIYFSESYVGTFSTRTD